MQANSIRGNRPDVNIEAMPVRHGERAVAVLTHQKAVGDTHKSSPLETAYIDCAADLVHHAVRGHLSQRGRSGDVALQPAGG